MSILKRYRIVEDLFSKTSLQEVARFWVIIVDEPGPEGNDSGCLPVRYLVLSGDRRKGLVAVLQLYMDESYSHPPAPLVYTIAGYVSESYRWSRFEREWQKVLDAEGIEFFHMKDYAHKRGVYADWTDKKRIKFLRTLQHIIKSNTEKDFAISSCGRRLQQINSAKHTD